MSMIINNTAYKAGKPMAEMLTLEEISEAIKDPETFVWLGVYEPNAPLLAKLKEEFCLHELAIEDASHAHQRPKIEVYGDSLFIVLKTIQLIEGTVQYGETHLFIGKNFLLSVRHGYSLSYAPVRKTCESRPAMLKKGVGFALYGLLDFIVNEYIHCSTHFETIFDGLEENIFKEEFDRLAIQRLYSLKRELLKLRNAALPVEDICNELMRFHEDIIPKELRVYFRDVQDHVHRLITSIDSRHEMLTTAMQVHLALVGVAQNDIVKRQTGWGAVLAIPAVVFSLYGMNFQFMPELKWQWGYPAVLILTGLGCYTLYGRLKKAKWV